jgi:rod shape-determining protein MreC
MGFFRRYPLFIAIVLILFIIQLVPLNNQNKIKESRFAGVILLITFYPQKTVNFLSNRIVNNWYKYISNINTYERNKRLREDISKLREENFVLLETKLRNRRLEKLLKFSTGLPYELIAANSIGSSPSQIKSQVIVIDKGRNYNLAEGMPVKTHQGIVGKVYMVGNRSSEVLLITDPLSAIDANVQRSRARGIVKGNGEKCIMEYLEKDADIKIGDYIITSGKDGYFPKGMLIGKVVATYTKGGSFQAEIEPSIDIKSVEELLVIYKLPNKLLLNE